MTDVTLDPCPHCGPVANTDEPLGFLVDDEDEPNECAVMCSICYLTGPRADSMDFADAFDAENAEWEPELRRIASASWNALPRKDPK